MSETILIVEDEVKLAKVLMDYLAQSNYKTAHLINGNGVIAWVKKNNPDLILLDLMLPGTNGKEICKDIRAFSKTPIIMVTAMVDEIDRLIGLELGADDYICKPFSPKEVVARVKAVLRRSDPNYLNDFNEKKNLEEFDKAAEDLRLATRHLGMIVGKVDVEEVLGSIFNDFCIGK